MTPQELKNSILQMAIQGKLVEQRPEEGTAEELYQQIQAEKQKLIKEKRIKKDKPLPGITDDEKPFDIPESWKWMRLGELCNIINGFTPLRSNELFWNNPTIAWFTVEDIRHQGRRITKTNQAINECALANNTSRILPPGAVLLCCTASVGEYAITEIPLTTNQQFNGLVIKEEYKQAISSEFIFKIAPTFKDNLLRLAGKTTFNFISVKKLADLPIAVPPLTEQKRIVVKIEELLPLIDRYEAAWTKLEAFNKRFPEDMQKSILQEAIQGKLVEQRPEEGTAEELYQQIQAEKQCLIAEKKIKKDKPLPEITDDEKPFDIPSNWKWCRIGEIFTVIRGSSPRPKGSSLYWASNETQFNWVTIKDITAFCENGVLYRTHEYLTEMGASKSTYVSKGELVIAVSGSTTGKFCMLGIDGYIYDGLAAVLNPTKIISYAYLKVFFSWIYDRLNAKKVGSAFPNINTDMLKNTLFPLPPLAEQKRIVAKIEQLLPLCERLK